MVTEALPPKLSAAPSPIRDPTSRSATCAAPMASGSVPKTLLMVTRTSEPPMLVRTTCRTVWSARRTGAPKGSPAAASPASGDAGGSSASGPVLQVPIQRPSSPCAAARAGERQQPDERQGRDSSACLHASVSCRPRGRPSCRVGSRAEVPSRGAAGLRRVPHYAPFAVP